ncbi:hypothetical protein [Aromatoleum toluclasticum]|nr:hypothetical protein [Aromatoleum toluclasticum]
MQKPEDPLPCRDFIEGIVVEAAAACLFWILAFVLSGAIDRVGV